MMIKVFYIAGFRNICNGIYVYVYVYMQMCVLTFGYAHYDIETRYRITLTYNDKKQTKS